MLLPPGLERLRGSHAGRSWIDALPRLVEECARGWSLRVGAPYPNSHVALVLPVDRGDGTPAVLKVQFPDRECEHEAAALRAWQGEGAVHLLDHDAARHALLLERCIPGTHLRELPAEDALSVLVDLLPRLWRPTPEPVGTLAQEAAHWRRSLPRSWERAGHPFERELFDAALEALEMLPGSQGPPVLLHQDLHADNVLRAEREPWLAIDPKPLVGEREFGVAPIVRSFELGHSEAAVLHRLDHLCRAFGLDRERARRWTLAQTLAWSFDGAGAVLPRHVETARWLHRAG
jgi:streptomycin 6-kinase